MTFVLVNFKTYEEGTGREALKLARTIDRFKASGDRMAIAVQAADLRMICREVKIPVFAQHMDVISYGSHTGSILPEALKKAGAKGVLINHSEKQLSWKGIKERVEVCKRLGLMSVVCASNLHIVKKVAKLKPNFIAYEPHKLIGMNVSVTTVNPQVIVKAAQVIEQQGGKMRLLVGAGVTAKRDVQKAEELGATGVLLAHKIVKAKKVKDVLKRMFK